LPLAVSSAESMARVFISYRRDDSPGDARGLADHLKQRFGPASVFLDIDTIDPGIDFERALTSSLQETSAMLVVIGPRWTAMAKADESRRLDDPGDYVRREVEAALGRDIPVVPVLVQGAHLPRKEDLPESLAALVKRQVATLDHAEFHDDAERLCDRLAKVIVVKDPPGRWAWRKWWPVAAVVAAVALALVVYQAMSGTGVTTSSTEKTAATSATPPAVEPLLSEASEQRRRGQLVDALATLARARALAPESDAVRQLQNDVAMEWIRNVHFESGTSTFTDAIKPALAVIDAALASATGAGKADLQAHSGWAAFLMWRDGNRQLDPAEWYRDALKTDPQNPYANAMLAHWMLFRGNDVDGAGRLFEVALGSGRAKEAVRSLQWAALGNTRTPESSRELVRLADAMRRDAERLTARQAQTVWAPYYFALSPSRDAERQILLGALPPDDHIKTLAWAFDDYTAGDESRRQTRRYYVALLHERAGQLTEAREQLAALGKELAGRPGSLQDAVEASLRRLRR
jgi:hypothetical protein